MIPGDPPVTAMGRRRFVKLVVGGAGVAAGVAGTGTLVASLRGAHELEVTRHRTPTPTHWALVSQGATPRARDSSATRLLQLSDLHLRSISDHQESVAEATHREEADVILLTGDTLHAGTHMSVLEAFLRLLPTNATKLAILGNWEYRGGLSRTDFRRSFERGGVHLLINESVPLTGRQGLRLTVSGVDDYLRGNPSWQDTFRDVPAGGPHLLLAHCPGHRDTLTRDPAAQGVVPDLVLSGHTHGGQVKILGHAPAIPRGSGSYVEGWYEGAAEAGQQTVAPLYVSRGIGTTFLPVRLGCTPEIAVFDWMAPAQ